MIEVNNIQLSFSDRIILKDVSFTIPDDFILGIVGVSGSGKSSLLKILSGYLDADAGTVLFNGKAVVGPSQRLIPGHTDIQLVNQDFALDIYHTVAENLRNKMVHLHRNQQSEFIDELLHLLQLSHVRDQKAWVLSGGEQQRLSIGRALAKEPEVLILDEPFAHLDSNTKLRLLHYIRALKEERKFTVIIVSHDLSDLLSLSDEIVILDNGTVLGKDTPMRLYYSFDNIGLAHMLGIVNQVEWKNTTVFFRPDQYEIVENMNGGINVSFKKAHFMGTYYLNEFWTQKKETLFLTAKESLIHVQSIKINKENERLLNVERSR